MTSNSKLSLLGRDSRDRLAGLLGLGIPHPLRDLALDYTEVVAQGVQPEIAIIGTQRGVIYQLCDDDGNPLAAIPSVEGTSSETAAILKAPPITEDRAFTILASRQSGDVLLETYLKNTQFADDDFLSQRISFKAGINTKLAVRFKNSQGAVVDDNPLRVSYGDRVTVVVEGSQEGVYYRLVKAGSKGELLSPVESLGNQGPLEFTTEAPLEEDLALQIKAERKVGKLKPELLETVLEVAVNPNPAVEFSPNISIFAYGKTAQFTLAAPQKSATYRLSQRPVQLPDRTGARPGEYFARAQEKTPGDLELPPEIAPARLLRPPARVSGAKPPFVESGTFSESGTRSVTTPALTEDAFFLVLATKKDNGGNLLLNGTQAVLVQPDPGPKVTVLIPSVATGGESVVVVNGTQPGVRYHLVVEGKSVNAPGYHYEDRGIETTRIGVDFVVEENTDQSVLLPTGSLRESTTFKVVATKSLTGLTADLTGTVDVKVAKAP